jgi:sec-independent protein translocase protein TatA
MRETMFLAGPAGLGAPEIIIICVVLLILFGAKKLPDFARGTGRALRIFKAETKGLMDDDDEKPSSAKPEQRQIDPAPPTQATPPTPPVEQPQVDSQATDTDR